MDYHTFLDSIASLPPYFEICAAEGAACAAGEVDGTGGGPALLLTKLRGPGLAAEKEMLRATGGVNTHKGAIFILGILAAAAGYCLAQKSGETDSRFTDGILTVAGRIAAPSLQDLEGPMQAGTEGPGGLGERSEPETEGLRQYRTDGCTGVRGEAAQGFPSLRSCALPVLRGDLQYLHQLIDTPSCKIQQNLRINYDARFFFFLRHISTLLCASGRYAFKYYILISKRSHSIPYHS